MLSAFRARPWRSLAVAALALALVAAIVAGMMQLDLASVGTALAGADPALLGVAVGAYLLGQTMSGAMWAICQRAGGVRGISMPTTLSMHWVARGACELLPASLGEAVRVGVVRRHPGGAAAGTWRIVGGIAGYKAIDAMVTGLAVLAITVASPLPGPAADLRWTALGAIGAVVAAALAWRLGALRRLVGLLPGRARNAAVRMGEGARVLGDGRAARNAALLGFAAVLARVVSLGALLAAFGAPAAAAGLAFSVIVLAGIIPGAPGGAGARELLLVPALALAHGVPTETAVAFSLAVQAAALATTLVAAAIALIWLSVRRPEAEVETAIEADPVPSFTPSG